MKNISQIKEAPSTESGNTRLNSQKMPPLEESLGIDWLDFRGLLCPTKIITFFDWVADQCDDLIDWETERACGRYVRFSCGFKSVRGGQYAYELTEGAAHVWISLPGKALAGCGSTMAQLFVAKACVEQGLSCTRLDVFLDDFGDRLAKIRSSIERAYDKGQHSGFKKLSKVISRVDWQSLPLETLYLGSRESASFVRIYDKSDRTRWERQTSREISDVVLADLLRVHEDARRTSIHLYDRSMADAIKAHLTNGIDFVRRKDKNLSRSGRCEFWQGFLN
ncbi:MAG: replication initiation factor domain-containing protein, partial [Candidatus Nanopelagicaceae bacterium]